MKDLKEEPSVFPRGNKAPAEYFTGTAYVNQLVQADPAFNTVVGDVVFEPGCRNNWHSHNGGQILLCTGGEGYYQEQGKPVQLLKKGDVVQIKPDIIHWHGATPHSGFSHIAISPNANLGVVTWMDPVTEEEYNSYQ